MEINFRRASIAMILLGTMAGAVAVFGVTFLSAPVYADSTGTPGQPSQSCQDFFADGQLQPQGFNTNGFANAESVYAGSQQQNSQNPNSVSQYDVACFQAASH